jgi:hypothetical protein
MANIGKVGKQNDGKNAYFIFGHARRAFNIADDSYYIFLFCLPHKRETEKATTIEKISLPLSQPILHSQAVI